MATPKFLVIGAGPAGKSATLDLLKSFPNAGITLVDARDKAYHTVAAPRALVDPAKIKPEDLFIPIADIFKKSKNGRFVKGVVKEVREREAELEDGTVLGFDYLVYAAVSLFDLLLFQHPLSTSQLTSLSLSFFSSQLPLPPSRAHATPPPSSSQSPSPPPTSPNRNASSRPPSPTPKTSSSSAPVPTVSNSPLSLSRSMGSRKG